MYIWLSSFKLILSYCYSRVVADAENAVPSSLQDRQSLLRHLEKTNPEALALARDWEDTVEVLMKTHRKITQ